MLLVAISLIGIVTAASFGAPATADEPALRTISGKVTIPEGAPAAWLAGIQVGAVNVTTGGSDSVDPVTGEYEITVVPGRYVVQFKPGHAYVGGKFEPINLIEEFYPDSIVSSGSELVDVTVSNAVGIDATLEIGRTISGKATVPAEIGNSALRAVEVTAVGMHTGHYKVMGSLPSATGVFEFVGLAPDRYQVTFNVHSYLSGGVLVHPNLVDSSLIVDVTAGNADVIDAHLVSGRTISGHVSLPPHADPAWMASVQVAALGTHTPRAGRVDPVTGDFTLTGLPAGTHAVCVSIAPAWTGTEYITLDLKDECYEDAPSQETATLVSTADGDVSGVEMVLDFKEGPQTSPSPFIDVPTSHPFYNAIKWLATEGISAGWDAGNGERVFRPNDDVARGAVAAFLYRYFGSPAYTPPTTPRFVDVPWNHPFYKEISWLAEQGISTGWRNANGTSTFRPDDPIGRDAFAVFLYRFSFSPAYIPPATPRFVDVPSNHPFYKEISWLAEQGISTGWGNANGTSSFRPNDSIARDAVAVFLYRHHQQQR